MRSGECTTSWGHVTKVFLNGKKTEQLTQVFISNFLVLNSLKMFFKTRRTKIEILKLKQDRRYFPYIVLELIKTVLRVPTSKITPR